jgi:hypothetical protein
VVFIGSSDTGDNIHGCIFKLTGRPLVDDIVALLGVPGVHFNIVCDEKDNFQAIIIQTEVQRELYKLYGEVVQLDGTFKVHSDIFVYLIFYLLFFLRSRAVAKMASKRLCVCVCVSGVMNMEAEMGP